MRAECIRYAEKRAVKRAALLSKITGEKQPWVWRPTTASHGQPSQLLSAVTGGQGGSSRRGGGGGRGRSRGRRGGSGGGGSSAAGVTRGQHSSRSGSGSSSVRQPRRRRSSIESDTGLSITSTEQPAAGQWWWQAKTEWKPYSDEHSAVLDAAYIGYRSGGGAAQGPKVELTIVGLCYVVDLETMRQTSTQNKHQSRAVQRTLRSATDDDDEDEDDDDDDYEETEMAQHHGDGGARVLEPEPELIPPPEIAQPAPAPAAVTTPPIWRWKAGKDGSANDGWKPYEPPVCATLEAAYAAWSAQAGRGGGSGEQQQQQQVVPLPGGVYHLLMLPHYFLLGSITQKWRAGWTDRDSAPVVPDCEISLGWFVCRYGVDLRSMRQIKLADPSRTRQVQRQVCTPKRFQLQCVPTSFLTRAGCIIRLR